MEMETEKVSKREHMDGMNGCIWFHGLFKRKGGEVRRTEKYEAMCQCGHREKSRDQRCFDVCFTRIRG